MSSANVKLLITAFVLHAVYWCLFDYYALICL